MQLGYIFMPVVYPDFARKACKPDSVHDPKADG